MVRQEGFEPPAYCLEGSCSIQLSYWRELNGAGDRESKPASPAWKAGALAIVLHLHAPSAKNRQLCYNSISVPFCQRFFQNFFCAFFMLSE